MSLLERLVVLFISIMYRIGSFFTSSIQKLLGTTELVDPSSLGSYVRDWSFNESGRYAASVQSLKDYMHRWNPMRLLMYDRCTGSNAQIFIYDIIQRKTYKYATSYLSSEIFGFYWFGDFLVLIGQSLCKRYVDLFLYKLDHENRWAFLAKIRHFAWSPKNSTPLEVAILPHYDEIWIDGRAYTPLLKHGRDFHTRIFLIPRSILADYPPIEYVCSIPNRGARIRGPFGRGSIGHSPCPAILGRTLYCHFLIAYAAEQKISQVLDQYMCIDLSKLQDVYRKSNDEIEAVVRVQDPAATTRKIMQLPDAEPFLFHSAGLALTHVYKHLRFIYMRSEDKSSAFIYCMNLKMGTVCLVKNNECGTSFVPHPLGFHIAFCSPSGLSEAVSSRRHQLVRDIFYPRRNDAPTLKGLAAKKVLLTEEIDGDTINCLKAVLV